MTRDMSHSEEPHLEAAAYANGRREAYLDLMKSGAVETLDQKTIGYIWVAHYEGFRDAIWAKREPE